MSPQPITPELRQWIISQAQAGRSAEEVLGAMRASGWQEDTAIAAMESSLQAFVADQARAAGMPVPVAVPEPDLVGGPSRLWAGDREVKLVFAMRNPRVVVFGGLLSDAECDELVALSTPRLVRSETVVNSTGDSEVNEGRTSRGMFFVRGEDPLIQRIEQRIASLLNWPVDHGEGLQILHYGPGAQYKPHHDYFDPAHAGTPRILQRGGQRVGTLLMYLNTPDKGGGTVFPDVSLEVAPVKGNGVFFSYDRPHPITRTLHGGAPVVEGEKWVATKWLREGVFT